MTNGTKISTERALSLLKAAKDTREIAEVSTASAQRLRVDALLMLGQAALNSQNPLDLAAAQQELGNDLSASEVATLLSFVQGALTEQQAKAALTTAQTLPDVAKLVEKLTADAVIDAVAADKLRLTVAADSTKQDVAVLGDKAPEETRPAFIQAALARAPEAGKKEWSEAEKAALAGNSEEAKAAGMSR